jgi:chromosome segregation ATPase
MTDISEVLSALKRGDLTVEEVLNELNDLLTTVKKGIDDLKQPIEDLVEFEKGQSDEILQFESSNLSLSQEITSLTNEKATSENSLQRTQEEYTETTEKRVRLETKVREISTELSNTKKRLQAADAELAVETETNQKIVAEISTVVESTEQKILGIEKQAEMERDIIRKSKGERMALEFLIKKNHIEFNELKVINSLDGRTNTDMVTITKVTGLSEALIAKTLEGLEKRNLLSYEHSTGAITVTGSLKL